MSWLDGIGNMFDSFLNPQKGYQKGQDQLNKYYRDAQGNLQPYNANGQSAYGDYSGAMKRLLDPAALEAEWTKGYSESPSAKNAEGMAQEHGLDAASGLGLMGSNTALNAIQGGTTQIGLDDRQNYLNNLMQKYMAGAGIAGNIYGTGASAASNMSNNAMNMGNNSAQMAYGEQNAPGDLFGKLLGTGISMYTGGMGGGGFGGSAGMPEYAKNAIMSSGGGGNGWSFGGR
jgi:hypothetical protein